jgi:molybdopterin-guanine dinucleotide biosynthesis protein A
MMDGAVVLAGGASTRMGSDKAWLDLDGRPLLEVVVSTLARCCAPIVIAARQGQRLPALDGFAVERVDDPVADGGPLVGVVAGLERLAARGIERAYLGSCDAASVSVRHVEFMLAQLGAALQIDPDVRAVVPCDPDGRVHPLASAVAVPAMLAHAKAELARGQLRLQRVFGGGQLRTVAAAALPDPRVLLPCNTPAQWRALSRLATETNQ